MTYVVNVFLCIALVCERAHGPPFINWLPESMDINNENTITLRHEFKVLVLVQRLLHLSNRNITASRQKYAGRWYLTVRAPKQYRLYHKGTRRGPERPKISHKFILKTFFRAHYTFFTNQ